MYELTSSEAATLLAILAKDGGGEGADVAASGIPTSTFFATRRKIYDAGWLTDRYVPNPWAVGVRAIDCVIVTPGPAERTRLVAAWSRRADNVLLWSGLNVLFGLFFRTEEAAPPVDGGRTVTVAADTGSLPVYFDYSRPWSRFIGVERDTGYPRSLGEGVAPPMRAPLSGVATLCLQDRTEASPSPRTRLWHSPSDRSRSEERLVEKGVVRSRTFLNLETLPSYERRSLGEIVFLTGELRSGTSSPEVLGALHNDCHVSPLLLADDGRRMILLALGQTEAGAARRTKLPRAAAPVTATLASRLRDLEMTIEPTGSVGKIVDHRYDRLFRSEPAGSAVTSRGVTTPPPGVRG